MTAKTVVEIPYVKFMIGTRKDKSKEHQTSRCRKYFKFVTHDVLDTWTHKDFVENGMFESLMDQQFRRLYFDLDFKFKDKNIAEKAKKCYNWLCSLEKTFGDCALCGYCADEQLYNDLGRILKCVIELKKDLKDCEGNETALSIHAVFYETRMDANEVYEIMKSDKYCVGIRGFLEGDEFDTSVYEEYNAEDLKERLFRHPYANKYKFAFCRADYEKKGVDPNKLNCPFDASQLVITPRGDERIVTRDEWIKVFPMVKKSDVSEHVQILVDSAKKDKQTSPKPKQPKIKTEDDWTSGLSVSDFDKLTPERLVQEIDKRYLEHNQHTTKEMFDALVNGIKGLKAFENVKIHGDEGDVHEEISLFPLFSGLYACEGDDIDNDDINDAINTIRNSVKLTKNAAKRWESELARVRKNRKKDPTKVAKTPGTLVIYLKTFNPEYFKTHIYPLMCKKRSEDNVYDVLAAVCSKTDDDYAFIPCASNAQHTRFVENYVRFAGRDVDVNKCEYGFCRCITNIKNAYYKAYDYNKIQELRNIAKNKHKLAKMSDGDKQTLNAYRDFAKKYNAIIDEYFDQYDYIHTTANEEKFLKREIAMKKNGEKMSKQYKRLYVRKVLYMANTSYLYRKNLSETKAYANSTDSFHNTIKRIYDISTINNEFNKKLKVFTDEDLLESDDGSIYPRYRDLSYDTCLTDGEWTEFVTAYKSTFKHSECADFAVKIMIQDIASGFHDNSTIIKFYYGTGGNNKDCETCIYENIINNIDLVFKTHKFDVLAEEKNKDVVSCLYVQFNEMPQSSKDKFMDLVNALKNYNETGKVKTRGLYQSFVTINCNVRFQCNTNNTLLRNWLLDGCNNAIKRRFFVAERVHSDEYSDWLYDFCHDVERCRALKMYIKTHADTLYTEKLNSNSMLKFFNAHGDIYRKYTEARVDEEFEALKDALCLCSCPLGTRQKDKKELYTVKVKEWFAVYVKANPQTKCTEKSFRSNVEEYLDYVNGSVNGKLVTKMYFVTDERLINAIKEHQEEAVKDIPEDDSDDDDDDEDAIEAQIAALQAKLKAKKSAK